MGDDTKDEQGKQKRRPRGSEAGLPMGLRLPAETIAEFKATAAKMGVNNSMLFATIWTEYLLKLKSKGE